MIRAEEIYNKFKEDWQKISSNLASYDENNPIWTKTILDYFSNEGENSYRLVSMKEYLRLDLIWYVNCEEYEDYYGLELALESEWGGSTSEIMDDFYKLVDVKAFLKVMIIGRSERAADEIIKTMSKIIQNGRIKFPEEEYLIIIFPQSKHGVEREEKVFSGHKINSQGNPQALEPYWNTAPK